MYREEWSEEKNAEVFGKCANPNWHGHNYNLFVTVKGEITHATGYLIDLKELKVIINDYVIEKLDHKNINLDVDFMKGMMASTELLCIGIFNISKAFSRFTLCDLYIQVILFICHGGHHHHQWFNFILQR